VKNTAGPAAARRAFFVFLQAVNPLARGEMPLNRNILKYK
jgi:hypothetical protein